MSLSVYTNLAAMQAQQYLQTNTSNMDTAIQRLSSGLQINTAADNPAGASISAQLETQIQGIAQANNNTNDAVNMTKTVGSALNEITQQLDTIRTLTLQAATGTATAQQQLADQQQVTQAMNDIQNIATQTQFNGKTLLSADGGSNINGTVFQIGANVGQTATMALGTNAANMQANSVNGLNLNAGTAAFASLNQAFTSLKVGVANADPNLLANFQPITNATDSQSLQFNYTLANGVVASTQLTLTSTNASTVALANAAINAALNAAGVAAGLAAGNLNCTNTATTITLNVNALASQNQASAGFNVTWFPGSYGQDILNGTVGFGSNGTVGMTANGVLNGTNGTDILPTFFLSNFTGITGASTQNVVIGYTAANGVTNTASLILTSANASTLALANTAINGAVSALGVTEGFAAGAINSVIAGTGINIYMTTASQNSSVASLNITLNATGSIGAGLNGTQGINSNGTASTFALGTTYAGYCGTYGDLQQTVSIAYTRADGTVDTYNVALTSGNNAILSSIYGGGAAFNSGLSTVNAVDALNYAFATLRPTGTDANGNAAPQLVATAVNDNQNIVVTLANGSSANEYNGGKITVTMPNAGTTVGSAAAGGMTGFGSNGTAGLVINTPVSNTATSGTSINLAATGVNYNNVLNTVTAALTKVDSLQSVVGAFQTNVLQATQSVLAAISQNTSATLSSIEDTNMAQEMVQFTNAQILQQTAMAMMTQANNSPMSLLKMIGG